MPPNDLSNHLHSFYRLKLSPTGLPRSRVFLHLPPCTYTLVCLVRTHAAATQLPSYRTSVLLLSQHPFVACLAFTRSCTSTAGLTSFAMPSGRRVTVWLASVLRRFRAVHYSVLRCSVTNVFVLSELVFLWFSRTTPARPLRPTHVSLLLLSPPCAVRGRFSAAGYPVG